MQLEHMQNLRNIFLKSVDAVKPKNLLKPNSKYLLRPKFTAEKREVIRIDGKSIDITDKQLHLVGFGKAVLGLAVEFEKMLKARLTYGVLSIPVGTIKQFIKDEDMQLSDRTCIEIYEGAANNQPDDEALETAKRIKKLAVSMTKKDILFVLISGGGSALLPMPKAPLTLLEKMEIIQKLSNKGAPIEEMNIVRIALSDIKGGQLAADACNAFAVISFVLSDIVNDPVDLIASGPTCATQSKIILAKDILIKHNMWDELNINVKTVILKSSKQSKRMVACNSSIHIIGSNTVATTASVIEGSICGYNPFIISNSIQGNVQQVVQLYKVFLESVRKFQVGTISEREFEDCFPFDNGICQNLLKAVKTSKNTKKPLLLIMGGEPTVRVRGNGLGGRNQELALHMALEFCKNSLFEDMVFLCAGTDGFDGPTKAAGAIGSRIVIEEFLRESNKLLSDVHDFLLRNDSYTFFQELANGKYHIVTGHTGTNVMDLHFILIL